LTTLAKPFTGMSKTRSSNDAMKNNCRYFEKYLDSRLI